MVKNANLLESFKKALDGIIYSLRKERHVQLAIFLTIIALSSGVILKISVLEYIAISFAASFVLVAELLNTALERTIDMITEEHHPVAMIAKDVSAAAVVIAILNAAIVAVLIILSRYKVI